MPQKLLQRLKMRVKDEDKQAYLFLLLIIGTGLLSAFLHIPGLFYSDIVPIAKDVIESESGVKISDKAFSQCHVPLP